MSENVAVPRWWLKQARDCLQGPLPSGQIGDCVFLLRDQIDDLLAKRSVEIWAPRAAISTSDRDKS